LDRWVSRAIALVVIGLVLVLAYRSIPGRTPVVLAEDPGPDARALETASSGVEAGAREGGLLLADLKDLDLGEGGSFVMPDGNSVPPLPASAPRHVRIGVVLVTFQGAQGAPPTARSKEDARALADRLAADGKTDFRAAVQRGDAGSSEDIGRIPRGILEPLAEYAVFTLSPGSVSDVIETPRGFWIAKRID